MAQAGFEAEQQTLLHARRAALIAANVLVFLGGAVFGLVELWQGLGAYFSIAGSTVNPTAAEIVTIEVCAAVSIVAALASVVLALLIRGRWAIGFGSLSAIGLVVAIVLAVILTSPQRAATAPQNDSPTLPTNYQPCYSGSNTCN